MSTVYKKIVVGVKKKETHNNYWSMMMPEKPAPLVGTGTTLRITGPAPGQWPLGSSSECYRYATARPDKLGTDQMAESGRNPKVSTRTRTRIRCS